mmetsp:Transcript_30851/g.35718  ORF Transcript_30851/g.35718 Transcript_30851/m.35718 type:complete len:195 (+) Transcript_30851:69-653(+)
MCKATSSSGDGGTRIQTAHQEEALVTQRLSTLLALFPLRPTTNHPAVLTPYLLLGSADHAKNVNLMKQLHVTVVLNCAEGEVGTGHYASLQAVGITCEGFSSSDTREYFMSQHFNDVLGIVRRVKSAGGVCFLHCVAGVNRSGFLAICLLCELEGLPLIQSATHARECRGRVCTNVGFQQQLLDLAVARHWPLC